MKHVKLTLIFFCLFGSVFAEKTLIGHWIEIESGLGMDIKEDNLIILNSLEPGSIEGTWEAAKNKLQIRFTENGESRGGEIPYFLKEGFLVIGESGDMEVYRKLQADPVDKKEAKELKRRLTSSSSSLQE